MKQIVSAKQKFIILGITLCLLSAFIGRAAPTIYHVSAVNGTAGDPFATIETVTPANNGDSTNGDITFKAETGAQVIVNGTERINDIKTTGATWTQEGTSDIYYIDLNETDAELTWSTLAPGCTADLYEDTAAYFTVGGNLLATDPIATHPYPLPGRLTNTATNYFYLIQADCNGNVTDSNRVGAFTFAIAPGD